MTETFRRRVREEPDFDPTELEHRLIESGYRGEIHHEAVIGMIDVDNPGHAESIQNALYGRYRLCKARVTHGSHPANQSGT